MLFIIASIKLCGVTSILNVDGKSLIQFVTVKCTLEILEIKILPKWGLNGWFFSSLNA